MDRQLERYYHLQNKIQSCYEEYREARHLQMNTVTAGATVLGIISGTSYWINIRECSEIVFELQIENNNSNTFKSMLNDLISLITFQRLVFWLVSIVFCATFLYVAKIGIENIMRYFYIRNLEIRSQGLIKYEGKNTENKEEKTPSEVGFKDNNGRGSELNFSEYAAPVLTNSPKHIGSIPTFLHFVCNYGALGLAVLFCFLLVLSQCLLMPGIENVDLYVLYFIIAIMVFTLVFYIRFSDKAQETVQFAWDESHSNYECQFTPKNGMDNDSQEPYPSSKRFKNKRKYLTIPRPKALKSSMIFVVGFVFAIVFFHAPNTKTELWLIIKVFIVFELLIYQCRYLINDIRGIIEDDKERKKGRLSTIIRQECKWELKRKLLYKPENNELKDIINELNNFDNLNLNEISNAYNKTRRYVGRAITDIVIRLAFALMFILYSTDNVKGQLFWCMMALIIITVLYEAFKGYVSEDHEAESKNKKGIGVFITVGFGYPLRFVVGMISANMIIADLIIQHKYIMIAALCTTYFYGSFASIMSWVRKIVFTPDWENTTFVKGHFLIIKERLKKRGKKILRMAEHQGKNRNEIVFSEYFGGLRIWNVYYTISILSATLMLYTVNRDLDKGYIYIIILISAVLISISSFMKDLFCKICGIIGTIAYLIVLSLIGLTGINVLTVIMLIAIVVIYFFQRFAPSDIAYIIEDCLRSFLNGIKEFIIGKDVYKLVFEKQMMDIGDKQKDNS